MLKIKSNFQHVLPILVYDGTGSIQGIVMLELAVSQRACCTFKSQLFAVTSTASKQIYFAYTVWKL